MKPCSNFLAVKEDDSQWIPREVMCYSNDTIEDGNFFNEMDSACFRSFDGAISFDVKQTGASEQSLTVLEKDIVIVSVV